MISSMPKINQCTCGGLPGNTILVTDCGESYVFCYSCHSHGPPNDDKVLAVEAWNESSLSVDNTNPGD